MIFTFKMSLFQKRDNLLEEARAELLDELEIRDENEAEIKKLEEEIMNKVSELPAILHNLLVSLSYSHENQD